MTRVPEPPATIAKAESIPQVLSRHVAFDGRTVVDVGCGSGDLVRWMAARGAAAIGIDRPEVVAKLGAGPGSGREIFLPGRAERLPLGDGSADAVVFSASLHHVPAEGMNAAIAESFRVLRPAGRAVFVEPVAAPGAYTEITRLTGDETEVRRLAYDAIRRAAAAGMAMAVEEHFYLERSFADFEALVRFSEPPADQDRVLAEARAITGRFAREAGVAFADFRYRSICRLNVLRK